MYVLTMPVGALPGSMESNVLGFDYVMDLVSSQAFMSDDPRYQSRFHLPQIMENNFTILAMQWQHHYGFTRTGVQLSSLRC